MVTFALIAKIKIVVKINADRFKKTINMENYSNYM